MITKSQDGVLFIDEAYDLNPAADSNGKPIVSELLTASENQRDSISFILAGYEDDINDKLFAYNDGLRSRFVSVTFEDFDEDDLKNIWKEKVKEAGWICTSLVDDVVSRRLVKGAQKKGFGNAREVRSLFSQASMEAMADESFDGSKMEILVEHVIGRRPSQNEKLKKIQKVLN